MDDDLFRREFIGALVHQKPTARNRPWHWKEARDSSPGNSHFKVFVVRDARGIFIAEFDDQGQAMVVVEAINALPLTEAEAADLRRRPSPPPAPPPAEKAEMGMTRNQIAWLLHYGDGATYAEIGRDAGISVSRAAEVIGIIDRRIPHYADRLVAAQARDAAFWRRYVPYGKDGDE